MNIEEPMLIHNRMMMKYAVRISLTALLVFFAFSLEACANSKKVEVRNWKTGQMMKYRNPFPANKPMTAEELNKLRVPFADDAVKAAIWHQFLDFERSNDEKRKEGNMHKGRLLVGVLYYHRDWEKMQRPLALPQRRYLQFHAVFACKDGITIAEKYFVLNDTNDHGEYSNQYQFELSKIDKDYQQYLLVDWEHVPIADVVDRVNSIYSQIDKETEAELDAQFCTQNYLNLKKRCDALSCKTDDIWRDYDHWLMGQDSDKDFRATIEAVEFPGDDTAALVTLTVHNFEDQRVTLSLVCERGNWYVNDFLSYTDDDEGGLPTELSEIDMMYDFLEDAMLDTDDIPTNDSLRQKQIRKTVTLLEKRYGMTMSSEDIYTIVGGRYLWGSIQFADEYRAAPREEGDDRRYALALDVLVDGDNVYVHEVLGNWYGEGDCSWNVDDEGHYVGQEITEAYLIGDELVLEVIRQAPESCVKGTFCLRQGKLIYEEDDE